MTSEQNNKAGPAINKQSREELRAYIGTRIYDLLIPLTKEEKYELLCSLLDHGTSANVYNHVPGVEVNVIFTKPQHVDITVKKKINEVSSDRIEIMISKAIRDQTGRVVAGQINDPNSAVSRSLLKNIRAGRLRD